MVGFDVDKRSLFSEGTKVEVSNDEEGLKGAWYRATIRESHPKSIQKKKKKVLVEYETLVMEDGSGPLVEHVNPVNIRPLPPEEEGSGGWRDFEVNDIVDAFHRDGWWVGTIRKVLEGSRYRVYFDNPPDVIDFEGRVLRLHWDWCFCEWVRPVKEQMEDSIFSPGASVEIIPDGRSLCDVWFPAIVVKYYGDNNFSVKFGTECCEDVDAVKVSIDSFHIRPIPPPFFLRSYELFDKVDAREGVGWRVGVVTKFLGAGRYNVFFKEGNEAKEFNHSEIRPHLEWVDGKWSNASKEIFVASDCLEQSCDAMISTHISESVCQLESIGASHNSGVPVVLGSAGPSLNFNSKFDNQHEMTGEKRFRIATLNHCYMHSQPHKDTMQEDCEEFPLSEGSKLSKGLLEMLTKETTRGSATPRKDGSIKRISRSPAVNWDFSQPERSSSGKNAKAKNQNVDELGCLKVDSGIRKKRAVKSKSNITSKKNRTRIDASVDTNKDGTEVINLRVPVICALKANGIRNSQAENSFQLESEEPLKLMMDLNEKPNNQDGDKTVKSGGGHRKRRGRPSKLVFSEPNVKEAGEAPVGGGACETGAEDCRYSDITMPVLQQPDSTSGGGSQKRKRGRPFKLVVKEPNDKEADASTVSGDGTGETGVEDCICSDVIMPVLQQLDSAGSPGASTPGTTEVSQKDCMQNVVSDNIADDDQPLSKWFGGNISSTSPKVLSEVQHGAGGGTGETGAGDCICSDVIMPVLQQLDSADSPAASIPGTAEVSQKDCVQNVVSDNIADDQPLSKWFGGNLSSKSLKVLPEVQHGAGGGTGETGAGDCICSDVIMPVLQQLDSADSPGASIPGTAEVSQKDYVQNVVSDNIADDDRPLSKWFGGNLSSTSLKVLSEVQHGAGGGTDEIGAGDCICSDVIVPVLQQLDSGDSPGASIQGTAKVSRKDCVQNVVSDNVAADDQPLSKCFGGNLSSTSLKVLRLPSDRIVNEMTETREGQLGSAPESSLLVTGDDSVPIRSSCLPFVKESLVWQTIESMEVFRILPQEPHFFPLNECKKEHREGTAIGLMVTFANLFEKISTLQIDNPSSLFYKSVEILDDLEMYGFDVTSLRDHVRKLLSIKDGHVQLLNVSKNFEEELEVYIQESATLEEEARDFERKMSEIQKQLEAIKSKKEASYDKIAKLRAEMEARNSCIQNFRSDFQKQATASWKLP